MDFSVSLKGAAPKAVFDAFVAELRAALDKAREGGASASGNVYDSNTPETTTSL